MSAISFWSSIKIPFVVSPERRKKTVESPSESKQLIFRGETPKTPQQVNKSKLRPKVVSLRVPTPLLEEKEEKTPYINNKKLSQSLKRKKKLKITLLTVPETEEVEEMSQTSLNLPLESSEEEFVSVPIVKRLSLEELQAVKFLMKERVRKRNNRKRRKGTSKKYVM